MKREGIEKSLPNLKRPSLPPGVAPGGHGGSHGYLMNEFVTSILKDRSMRVCDRIERELAPDDRT